MNYSTAVFLINKSVRAIGVSYEPDPSNPNAPKPGLFSTFKTLDQSIQPKDFVTIPTNTRWGMTTARVETVDIDVDFDSPVQLEWIIGKVDKSAFDGTIAMENDAIAAIRSAEVRRKREQLAKDLLADNEGLASLPIAGASDAIQALSPPPVEPKVN